MEVRLGKRVRRFGLELRIYEGDGDFRLDCLKLSLDDWGDRRELLRIESEEFIRLLDELRNAATELEYRGRQIRDLLAGSDIFYVEDVEN